MERGGAVACEWPIMCGGSGADPGGRARRPVYSDVAARASLLQHLVPEQAILLRTVVHHEREEIRAGAGRDELEDGYVVVRGILRQRCAVLEVDQPHVHVGAILVAHSADEVG